MKEKDIITNPKNKKIASYESKRIPRSNPIYKRIESFSLVDFNNKLYFEFFLRIPEFKKVFDCFYKEIYDASFKEDYSDIIHKKIIPKYKSSFSKFDYDSKKVAYYIASELLPHSNIHFEVSGVNNILQTSLNEVLLKKLEKAIFEKYGVTISANINFNYSIDEYDLELLNLSTIDELKTIINSEFDEAFNTFHYKPAIEQEAIFDKDYNLNPLISIDLTNSKEATKVQILSILDQLYTNKEENISVDIKTLIHKQNPQNAFADYFCVYDNLNLGIPIAHLAKYFSCEIGEEPNESTKISRVTIYRIKDIMEQQLKKKNFLKLTI